jgi:hypothetical protein
MEAACTSETWAILPISAWYKDPGAESASTAAAEGQHAGSLSPNNIVLRQNVCVSKRRVKMACKLSGGKALRILNIVTIITSDVSFTPWPFYPQNPLDRRLRGAHSRSGHTWLHLPGVESQSSNRHDVNFECIYGQWLGPSSVRPSVHDNSTGVKMILYTS